MAELGPELANEIAAACQAGAAEAAEAFSRTLDATIEVSVGEPGSFHLDAPPEGFDGPGLVVVLEIGAQAAVFVLPESGGLLPDWYANPDPTGESRLSTLAQELGMLLLPESFMPESFRAGRVERLDEALQRAGVADGAGLVSLELTSDEKRAAANLLWPALEPGHIFGEPSDEAKAVNEQPSSPTEAPPAIDGSGAAEKTEDRRQAPPPASQAATPKKPLSLDNLPSYARSLLHIRVPVMVTLASKEQPIGQILELGPGSIIQFEKSCEELLDLEVAGRTCAQGEAVKVGDKFGIRLTSLVLPDERFGPLQSQRAEGNES